MGEIEKLVTSPEWAEKSPLEKAAARKDLFAITLDQNPEFKADFDAADEAQAQAVKDEWQGELQKKFPKAFTTKGYTFVKEEGGNAYKYPKEREADVPVADYKTEQVLASITPDSTQGRKLLNEYYSSIKDDPEKVKPFRILMRSRYGNINDILKTDEIDEENITVEQAPSAFEKGVDMAKQLSPTAVRVAGAVGGGMMGGAASTPSAAGSGPVGPMLGFSAGSAGGAAAVEPFAQWLEQRLGQRDRYSVGEGLLNVGLSAINPVKVGPGAGALMKLGARATEGAALAGAQNALQQGLFSDKPFSLSELNESLGAGAVVGGGLEGMGQLSSKIRARLIGKNADEVRRSVSEMLADVKLPKAEKKVLTSIQQRIDEMAGVGRTAPDAAASAARFEQALDAPALKAADTELAARETRTADFSKARTEEVLQEIPAARAAIAENQAGGRLEQIALGDDAVRNQITAIETRPGSSARERARLEAKLAEESPVVDDGAVKAQLSPQAQRMYDQYGGIRAQVMASIAGGGAGGVAGATQGETPEERLQNTLMGFLAGAGVSGGIVKALAGKSPRLMREVLRNEAESATDDVAKLALAKAEAQVAQIETALTPALKPAGAGTFQPVTRQDIDQIRRGIADDLGESGVSVKLAANEDGSIFLYDLNVDPSNQGRGVGTKAVEHIKKFSNQRGIPVELAAEAIDPSRQKDVEAFYRKQGFYKVGKNRVSGNPIMVYDPRDVDYQYTYQAPEVFEGRTLKGYLQIDEVHKSPHKLMLEGYDTDNIRSTSRDKLRAEGVSLPDISALGLPSGRYSMDEIRAAQASPPVLSISRSSGYIDPTLMRSLSSAGAGLAGGAYGLTQGETAEERIKNGLTYSILGAGGGYAAGRMFSRLAQNLPQKPGSPELDKWYKRLGSASTEASFSEKLKNLPNRIRTQMTTSFAPLDKLHQQIAAANNTPLKTPDLPLSRQFELVSGASGKALADAEDYSNNVLSKVGDKDWKDFNALLAIKRTGQRLQADQNLQAEQLRIQAIDPAKRTPAEAETLKETPNRRRVADETIPSVDAALSALEKKLGAKRFAELDQLAAGEFQQEADKALRVMLASGRMSQNAYAAIKTSNDFYAPFRVMEYADEFDGFKGMRNNPVDTTRKITHAITGIDSLDFHLDDPAKIMAERIYQSRVLAEKNLKMNVLAKLADDDASGTVIKKLAQYQDAPRGMEVVNYFDQGVPRQLAVAPDVAEAIKGLNPASTGIIANFVKKVNTPFRFGATGGNIGFQAINAPFDLYRQAALSKYGAGRGKPVVDTLRYPLDFIQSLYSSVMARPGSATAAGAVTGFYGGYQEGDTQPEKFKNAAVGAIVGGAAGSLAQGGIQRGVGALRSAGMDRAAEALDPNELYRQFYQSGAAGSTLQDMIERVSGDSVRRTIPQSIRGPGVISTLQDFGRAVEETTKLLGFKRGLRIEGIDKLSKQKAYDKLQEVVSETRNFAGSPDFAVAGNAVRDLNAAIVFLNPRIQGMVEDGGRLFGRDGMVNAAKAWTALGSSVGLGAAYLWYRNNQDENKADYAQVSPEEKWRNAMIPRYDDKGQPLYFTNERGEKVREYWRIPLRDTAQNFYQMTQSSLDFAQSKDPARVQEFGAELLENLSPINIQGKNAAERMESAISGLGPVGTIPYMLATQRIPGLHREIFRDEEIKKATPENQYTATTPQVYRAMADIMPQFVADPLRSPMMLEQLTQGATGGAFSQFTPQKPLPGRDPSAVAMQQSPLGRRFVRSGYVHNPAPEEAQQAIQKQADDRTSQKRTGGQLLDEFTQLQPDERRAKYQTLAKEDQQALRKEYTNRSNRPSSEEAALIRKMGVENGVRANYIFEQASKRQGDARREYLSALEKDDLLSNNIREQMRFLFRRQQQAKAGRN